MCLGSICHPDRIGSKITRIYSSYKIALDQINQSGNGLEGDDEVNFFNHIRNDVCKWFDVLHEVYGDKPSSTALWTNEMNSDDDDSNIYLRQVMTTHSTMMMMMMT